MKKGRIIPRPLDEEGVLKKADAGHAEELGGGVGEFLGEGGQEGEGGRRNSLSVRFERRKNVGERTRYYFTSEQQILN